MDWVSSFERNCSVSLTDMNLPYLIIEGECPYIQALNNISFALSVQGYLQFFNQNNCMVYDNFNEVAFLVTDWIKIQDSLEMVFNLMTGSHSKSLQILSYLRANVIPAHEFALYLFNSHKIILVNRFTAPEGNPNRCSKLADIKKRRIQLRSAILYVMRLLAKYQQKRPHGVFYS